jgi:AraC-like DNA-binding protein
MRILSFPAQQMLQYVLTGKFKAPNPEWKHELFNLIDYELFVMTEGTLYLSYNEEDFTIKAGEYLLLPPCNSWRKGFKESYCSFYWLHFAVPTPVDDMSNVVVGKTDNTFTIPQMHTIPKLEKMVVLMKQLQDSVKSNYPVITLDAMTTSIVTELYGQLCLNEPIQTKSPSRKQIYSDIIDYIQLNITKNIKVSDVATHFGYNEKYLSHLFGDISGIPLKHLITQRKMEAANYMLTDTNTPIADIAKSLGFLDSHNFSRSYKKFTGLTPSEYRNAFAKRLLYHK